MCNREFQPKNMVAWQWNTYNTIQALLHDIHRYTLTRCQQTGSYRVSKCKIKKCSQQLSSSCSPLTTSSTLPGACSLKMANRIHTCPSCISHEDMAVAYTKSLTREPLLSFLTNRSLLHTQFPFSSLNTVQLPPPHTHSQHPATHLFQTRLNPKSLHKVATPSDLFFQSAGRVHCISNPSVNLRPWWRLQ